MSTSESSEHEVTETLETYTNSKLLELGEVVNSYISNISQRVSEEITSVQQDRTNLFYKISFVEKREKEIEVRTQEIDEEIKELKLKFGYYLDTVEDTPVRLDIGGDKIKVSRKTLCCIEGSLLSAMFSGSDEGISLVEDEDGYIFIDEDPKHFKLMLNYLRSVRRGKHVNFPQMEDMEKELFVGMCEYFGVLPKGRNVGRYTETTLRDPIDMEIDIYGIGPKLDTFILGNLMSDGPKDVMIWKFSIKEPIESNFFIGVMDNKDHTAIGWIFRNGTIRRADGDRNIGTCNSNTHITVIADKCTATIELWSSTAKDSRRGNITKHYTVCLSGTTENIKMEWGFMESGVI